MAEFLYAAELKKRFTCYGHFYEWVLMDGQRVKCRSVLEIVDSAIMQEHLSDISLLKPDVVVVMMNPGSSHPKDIYHIDQEVEYPQNLADFRKELVLTQPDNTQYQIMRIAVEMGWHHIRVLNLSDLRDPKSGSFLQRVESLSEIIGGHMHSIFCNERAAECKHALARASGGPIMLGWGQDTGLLPMVEVCMQKIAAEDFCTVSSDVHPLLNAHPSPMLQKKKEEWLDRMLAELKNRFS